MVKEIIKGKSRNIEIYLEYDKERYSFEYVENSGVIVLRRLSDGIILSIFDEHVGFIVQCDAFSQTNFLVSDYSHTNNYGAEDIKFQHYIDEPDSLSLIFKNQFKCDNIHISECRVANSSFLVEQDGYSARIYNLDKESQRFSRVYKDKKIDKIIGDTILLVSEKKHAYLDYDTNDTITYGINPETLEIVTPIWSKKQERYIDIYTKEQVDAKNEELKKNNMCINKNHSLSDITIYFEIERYLNEIAASIDKTKNVYLDLGEYNVNEEFVKKFVKRK